MFSKPIVSNPRRGNYKNIWDNRGYRGYFGIIGISHVNVG